MRRSAFAVFGIAALLVFAACSPDRADRAPLAPTEPLLAAGDICAGGLASQIRAEIRDLFTGAARTDLETRFDAIRAACPTAPPHTLMMAYLQKVIDYRGTIDQTRGTALVNHWASLALYVGAEPLSRNWQVLSSTGGAAVLSPGQSMTTFDQGARLEIKAGTVPSGPHLFTFEAVPNATCDGFTSLPVAGPAAENLRGGGSNCYDVRDYPHETSYTIPPAGDAGAVITLCMRHAFGETGIVHQTGFGGELLPEVTVPFSCSTFHASLNSSWLEREAGPLGRALARAYDYLRPQPLFADDVGESGSIGSFSLVGGSLNTIFEENWTNKAFGTLPPGTDPVVGDNASSWVVDVNHPGTITIQNGLGNMTGKVVVISQAQGNCNQCPTLSLLGTRINPTPADLIGSYEITWTSLQNKPSVKEAPFVVQSSTGAEIARVSYATKSNKNQIKYNNAVVGTWAQNVSQNFKIILNLNTLDPDEALRTTFFINDVQVATSTLPAGTTFSTIGYKLSGIDAGIIAADNFRVRRRSDIP